VIIPVLKAPIVLACEATYADRVGRANGNLDLLESIDGRSYKPHGRSEKCMSEGLFTQRDNDNDQIVPRAIPI